MPEALAAGVRPGLDASFAALRAVAEALEDAVWIFDPERSRLVFANAACAALWGLRAGELSEDPARLLAALHPQDRERLAPDALLRPASACTWELRLAAGEAGARRVQHRSVPLCDALGRPVATLGITRDDTPRIESEAARRETEQRFEVLARSAFEVITELDSRGRVLWANKSAPSASFHATREVPARPRPDLIHPEDREQTVARFRAAFRDGEDTRISFRAADPDGSWHWLETFVSPFEARNGERRVLLMSRDVTERRSAEDRLRENEERYRQLVEQSPLGIVVHADGLLRYANPAAVRLIGVASAADLLGRDFRELVEPASAAEVSAQLARLAGGARGDEAVEFGLRRPSGETRVVIGRGSLVRYAGRPACQYVMSDITERKHAERERERLQAQLQEARKLESLGVLAGGIAHDFNNLLAVVLGNVRFVLGQGLLAGGDAASEARAALEDAAGAGESAARLTRQLLAYAGRRAPEVRSVDLSEHARSVSGLLEAAVPKKVRFALDLAAQLPPVRADVAQLEQVTMNLVLNAAEAIGSREGEVRIRTGTLSATRADVLAWIGARDLEAGAYVWLEVSDTGCGMDEDTQQRIFDPFFTTKQGGHGLGLSAVLGLVRGHGGGISLTSRPGAGTTIRVHLPASEATAAAEAPVARSGAPLHATVLVVDDEPMIRRAVKRILASSHCRVLEACDGLDAVETFRRHQSEIDLVLLDLNMPRAGGEEALRLLRELEPDLPVLLSSGYDGVELAQRLGDERCTRFIAKPYLEGELRARIEGLLAGR